MIGIIVGGVVTASVEGTINLVAVVAAIASGLSVFGIRFFIQLWRTPLEIAGEDQRAIQDAYERAIVERDDARRVLAASKSEASRSSVPTAEAAKARADRDFIANLLHDVRRTLNPTSGAGTILAASSGPDAMRACRERVCAQVRERLGAAAAERIADVDVELDAAVNLSSASAAAFAHEQHVLRRTRENLTFLLNRLDLHS